MNGRDQTKVALITGGGSGIGRAAAILFSEPGWRVMVSGRRESPLSDVADLHANISYHVADVSDVDQARGLVARTIDVHGRLDTLVNNAGILGTWPTETVAPDDIARLFATNVFAPVYLVSAAIPHLKVARGSIVNVSSAVAQRPTFAPVFYGATKATLDYLTRSWAAELADAQIRVNAVAPGPILGTIIPQEDQEGMARVRQLGATSLLLKRPGEPDEIARWIHLLADPASSWVTGQVIAVDGGMAIA